MRISPESRLVRYTYFIGPPVPPRQTTLCRFFWRFFFSSLLWLGMATLVGLYLSAWWTDTFKTFSVTAGVLAFVGVLITGHIGHDKYKDWKFLRGVKEPGPVKRVLKEAFWGIKNRICPVIYITTDGPSIFVGEGDDDGWDDGWDGWNEEPSE